MWQARRWRLALIGGTLGTLAGGALFVGTIVGGIGLLLLVASRGEFQS
jgi:hypothetical protein